LHRIDFSLHDRTRFQPMPQTNNNDVAAFRFPRHDVCGGIGRGGLVLLSINSAYATTEKSPR
jgi:hypothetical protein